MDRPGNHRWPEGGCYGASASAHPGATGTRAHGSGHTRAEVSESGGKGTESSRNAEIGSRQLRRGCHRPPSRAGTRTVPTAIQPEADHDEESLRDSRAIRTIPILVTP